MMEGLVTISEHEKLKREGGRGRRKEEESLRSDEKGR
jgi:hypothetical protein